MDNSRDIFIGVNIWMSTISLSHMDLAYFLILKIRFCRLEHSRMERKVECRGQFNHFQLKRGKWLNLPAIMVFFMGPGILKELQEESRWDSIIMMYLMVNGNIVISTASRSQNYTIKEFKSNHLNHKEFWGTAITL